MKRMEVRIESLASGGDGVGRLPDGRAVFVRMAAPGDRVLIELTQEKARFARGRIHSILEPGAGRIEPRCRVFGECWGCSWQHVDDANQLIAKKAILFDALTRIGKFEDLPPIAMIPSPAPYGYRSRSRLQVRGDRVGFLRWKSHALCDVEECPVLMPALQPGLDSLRERARRSKETGSPGLDGEWELAVGNEGSAQSIRLARDTDYGALEKLCLRVGGERLRVTPGGFMQSNGLMFEILHREVAKSVADKNPGLLLELFSGAGFFTLGLARHFDVVVAVESAPRAVMDLRANLDAAGISNTTVIGAEVEDALVALEGRCPSAILLDPPRVGVGVRAATQIAALGARRIAYLSCDPATLARDLVAMMGERYAISEVKAFDLFPQTPHVEALVVLDRVDDPYAAA